MEDHAEIIDAFAAGPPSSEAAARLIAVAPERIEGLIAELSAARERAHLEMLGRSPLPKPLRKAAKRAAYALRSAGVEAPAPPRAAVDLSTRVDLEHAALVGAPGLSGRHWLMLTRLPDTVPLAIELPAWGQGGVHTTELGHFTPAVMRRYAHTAARDDPDRLELASASLALRMIEHITEEARERGGDFGALWERVQWWCARARELGADAAEANAAVRLADEALAPPPDLRRTSDRLLDVQPSGLYTLPQRVIDALLHQVADVVLLDPELTRDQFMERLHGLADVACDAYFADARTQQRAARALSANADVLWHIGQRDAAIQSLWLADQLSTGAVLPHELELLAQVFRTCIDYEGTWRYRVDHLPELEDEAAEALVNG